MIVIEGEEGDLPASPKHPQPPLREETPAAPPQEVTSHHGGVAPPLSRVIVLRWVTNTLSDPSGAIMVNLNQRTGFKLLIYINVKYGLNCSL